MIPRTLLLIVFSLTLSIPAQDAYASAVVEQKRRAIRQQQEALQRQQVEAVQRQKAAYQQSLQQRAAQQNAYNQAIGQRVADVRAQAIQDAQQQAINQMQAQNQAYQQALGGQQQQQRQAQQGVLSSGPNQQPQMPGMNMPGVADPMYGNLFYTPPVQEVVNITDVWKQMEDNSQSWSLMIDMQPKVLTVQRMIDYFKDNGVRVNKPASHYVQLIDSMAFSNPTLLDQPFESIMKVVAIIEYDFNNGQDKDALARQIFPDDKQFRANKARLGL